MARDFDGVNDRISFGSDASIDDFTTWTRAFWIAIDNLTAYQVLMSKEGNSIGETLDFRGNTDDTLELFTRWTTTHGRWRNTTALGSALTHVACTYDRGAVGNDPIFYLNGSSDATIEVQTPVGTSQADASENLLMGEAWDGFDDFDGRMGWICYDNVIWTAAQVNRHKWWGSIGGGVKVAHPLVTDSLTNKGTATANGTATGTTMTSLPRVERNWGSMMGVGR